MVIWLLRHTLRHRSVLHGRECDCFQLFKMPGWYLFTEQLSICLGCEGGFPYLVAGKYAEDFGAVVELCNPYKGQDHSCSTHPDCHQNYATGYKYVGGYYGG